ncbi:MAG TPA: DUF6279 family lipoprotein [Gammaproteobacteria bacterium]|nr:DUF6279 family lipoprotein [Gammaproteobacteria bacterium]HRP88322.1 DUF6279 family lipoprotein [Gammaproteobacteria bacterium]
MPRFRAGKFLLALLVLAALGAGSGCATSFLYERADRFANRWMGDYLELDPAQQESLDTALAELHRWHRREQLPAYAAWLRSAAADLAAGGPYAERALRGRGTELGGFWRELAEAGAPALTAVGATLSDAQVEVLLEALREARSKEFEYAAARPDSYHQQRSARSMERFLRRWTGRMTAAQQAMIRDWAAALEPSRVASLENRAGWIEALERALERRADPAALRQAAESLFVAPSSRWDPDYAALVERNTVHTTTFMAEFLAGLDERQRRRAVERLERLAAEFEQLAAAGS